MKGQLFSLNDICINHPKDVRHFHQALEEAGQWFNSLTPEEKSIACQTYAGYSLEQVQDCQSFELEQQKNYQISDYERCQEWMLKNNEIDNLLPASQDIFQTFE